MFAHNLEWAKVEILIPVQAYGLKYREAHNNSPDNSIRNCI